MIEQKLEQLAAGYCVPPDGNYERLTDAEIETLIRSLSPTWEVVNNRLQRVFACREYLLGVELARQIAALADRVDHHPRLVIEWRQVTVEINTHAVAGLAMGDFVFAAKTELLARQPGFLDDPD